MQDPTHPVADEYGDDHPIIGHALAALRSFGGDIERVQAAMLLAMWSHRRELSDREWRAIMRRFPGDDIPAGAWLSDQALAEHPDGGWISGGMT